MEKLLCHGLMPVDALVNNLSWWGRMFQASLVLLPNMELLAEWSNIEWSNGSTWEWSGNEITSMPLTDPSAVLPDVRSFRWRLAWCALVQVAGTTLCHWCWVGFTGWRETSLWWSTTYFIPTYFCFIIIKQIVYCQRVCLQGTELKFIITMKYFIHFLVDWTFLSSKPLGAWYP